jgi:mRNA-degrading endonuclease toxin of MazEF toxin-antitoxin module
MKNTLVITLVIALILTSYFLGRRTPTEVEIIKRDTITVVKTDTIRNIRGGELQSMGERLPTKIRLLKHSSKDNNKRDNQHR